MLRTILILVFTFEYLVCLERKEKYVPFICTTVPDRKTQLKEADTLQDSETGLRSYILNNEMHWPGGLVPYEIDDSFSSEQVSIIQESMEAIMQNSCVRWLPRGWLPRGRQRDYVRIVHSPQSGVCNSQVGRQGFRQDINLNDICFDFSKGYKGSILHEMMHTLGFIHEQQRLDRKCYVRVTLEAVEKYPSDYAMIQNTNLEFPYDFNSIMHYGTNNFLHSKTHDTLGNVVGRLTELDVMKLNHMYCGGLSYCEMHTAMCSTIEENAHICVYH